MAETGQIAFRNRSVEQSRFGMVPRSDIPRSAFKVQHSHKTTFNLSQLVPIYVSEALPGDSYRLNMTAFCRLATPVFPVMDNFRLTSFFFFVPNRLVWTNWRKFMGERVPNDFTEYVTPRVTLSSAIQVGSWFDYMGVPVGNLGAAMGGDVFTNLRINALPFRGYQLIYDEWFRDQNLSTPSTLFSYGDGPDVVAGNIVPVKRMKGPDYFTTCLPWPQKGTEVSLPLGTRAPVRGIGTFDDTANITGSTAFEGHGAVTYDKFMSLNPTTVDPAANKWMVQMKDSDPAGAYWPDIYADLSSATAATINALRQAMAVQKLLERNARGGTRYTELLLAHFGVSPQDARLQRPEYIGGGVSDVLVSPIAQTSATGLTGGSSPIGSLGAVGTSVARHGFSYSVTEHGFVFGIVCVTADITYQQGLHRMFSRTTRYDYYWPAFAHLGEQAVLRKEIYATGDPANDDVVFGYQERWAEYRYHPSMISGLFRSKVASNIDEWHMSEEFASAPVLNETFMADQGAQIFTRVASAGAASSKQEVLFDGFFDSTLVRAMPTYSVPGMSDRF